MQCGLPRGPRGVEGKPLKRWPSAYVPWLCTDHLKKLSEAPTTDAATRKELELVRKQIDDCNGPELGALLTKYKTVSPAGNAISEPFAFNLMFASQIGPHGNLQGYEFTAIRSSTPRRDSDLGLLRVACIRPNALATCAPRLRRACSSTSATSWTTTTARWSAKATHGDLLATSLF